MTRYLLGLLLCVLCLPASADWQDQQEVTFDYASRPVFDRVNQQYRSLVTLTHHGSTPLSGTMRVMVDASSHSILNADGELDGKPYLMLDSDTLTQGQSLQFNLMLSLERIPLSLSLRLQSQSSTSDTGLVLAENQIALFYQREDRDYSGWGLHLWQGEGCGNYASPTSDSPHFANWANPYPADGVHAQYGAYYILSIEPGAACYNFIIHKGDAKALGPDNSRFVPGQGQQGFTFDGYPEIWYQPITTRPLFLDGARAHWLATDTLLWQTGQADEYRLYHSASAGLSPLDVNTLQNTSFVALLPQQADDGFYQRDPQLQGFSGFNLSLTDDDAKQLARAQLIAVALDSDGNLLDATRVQSARLLDYLYTRANDDADEAVLGVQYLGEQIRVSVWAPTATSLSIALYDKQKNPIASHPMQRDNDTGIWTFTGPKAELDRQFYRFQLDVYHPLTEQFETLSTTDPYSLSLSTNGRFSQLVNLDDADLKPAGWDNHPVPTVAAPEDSIIYETHIRDFSIWDETVSSANRGKYLAFTEAGSQSVQHLRALQQAGLTHIHLLPANDIASVEEDTSKRVELTDTVARLCQFNAAAPVCGVENPSTTIQQVLEGYTPGTADAQALIESMRSLDGFNWGYDPQHFAAPEGSYATDPDGEARIVEMRAMNLALHEMGLRTVLDVVYNHTASSGLYDNSVLDKLVPGYYQRLNEVSGRIENSTCCENTATEMRMMSKLMDDSLVIFAQQFGFDGFRFDLMGHIPRQAVLAAREAVRAVDPDTYFYGEGWNFGEVVNNRRFEQASQLAMAGTEVGTFSDRQREALRSGALFSAGGSLHEQDTTRIGLAGNIGSFEFVAASGNYLSAYDYQWNGQPAGYAQDPADTVNYVSKHDNETLWDKLQLVLPSDLDAAERVRIQNQALSYPLLSQGIPFLHLGSDLLRSKSMDRNTYDSGDWFNRVDFSMSTNNWNVGLPRAADNQNNWQAISAASANPNSQVGPSDIAFSAAIFREFVQIRAGSPLLRLRQAEQVRQRLKFHNTGAEQVQGLIAMSLDDGLGLTDLDPTLDALLVVFNSSAVTQSIRINNASGFVLHPVQQHSLDSRLQQVSISDNLFTVPPRTSAVFVKPQNGDQGYGLSALPPYGDKVIFLRGGLNGWDTSMPFHYQGNDRYSLDVQLQPGTFEFKIADADFASANLGGGFQVAIGQAQTIYQQGNNLSLDIIQAGEYRFALDASNRASPSLTVIPDDPSAIPPPYGSHTLYLRGSLNGWGTTMPLPFAGNGRYQAILTLPAGNYAFKIADADWGGTGGANLGGNSTVTPGDTVDLVPGSNDNLSLSLSEGGEYQVTVDASNLASPVLTVELP
ncbi:pullulanase-type alpha-1,6-glucosidase [Bowmanella denitrificans]|uniref:Pullulanase-type alpha-1,6-glucosidase n=1 Tax=Bowmanella denitrificans TaxID=366582 RepID=A0ABP3GLV1_9ALTE